MQLIYLKRKVKLSKIDFVAKKYDFSGKVIVKIGFSDFWLKN